MISRILLLLVLIAAAIFVHWTTWIVAAFYAVMIVLWFTKWRKHNPWQEPESSTAKDDIAEIRRRYPGIKGSITIN
ncbi:MAG: hypothetical protein Q7R62_02115 [bacterium]|nr:hypothetical protein [bacterium]